MDTWQPLEVAISSLFSSRPVAVHAAPALVDEDLFPEELARVRGAVVKRRAEFGTARLCARRALGVLGVAPGPLLADAKGAPRWPEGVVGSISHTRSLCAAVVQRSCSARAIGLDVEERKILSPAIVKQICTPRECHWLGGCDAGDGLLFPLVHFSAKEAFYKCQYALIGADLDFDDVEIELDPVRRSFRVVAAKAPSAVALRLGEFEGRFALRTAHVFCGVEARPASRRSCTPS
jgi:4'-phosphopantetheinyl transferase EntD